MDYFHPTVLALSSFSHEFCCKLSFSVFLDTLLHHCKFSPEIKEEFKIKSLGDKFSIALIN